jgi:hypothetical protein
VVVEDICGGLEQMLRVDVMARLDVAVVFGGGVALSIHLEA